LIRRLTYYYIKTISHRRNIIGSLKHVELTDEAVNKPNEFYVSMR